MTLRFTKMHGAGNDFIVLDATRVPLELPPARVRALADRQRGIGADQILVVGPAPSPQVDFSYRIFNSSGEEVEHCGNGARCFLRFVRARGLASGPVVRVQTMNRVLELREQPDGRVTVDMGAPEFAPERVPFDTAGLVPRRVHGFETWALEPLTIGGQTVEVAVLSMGNPHAVLRVDDVETAPVAELGPRIERHPRFPQRVNAGFLQVVSRTQVRLRVFERGAGETLACGTGACAAVVAGIRLGWLDDTVDVDTRGGRLTIAWAGAAAAAQALAAGTAQALTAPVQMTGPAAFVFEGETEL
jgi:diaminopimelate epimerase